MRANATAASASKRDGKICHQTQNVTAHSGCRTEPKLKSWRNIVCCNTQGSSAATMAAAGLWESCRTSGGCIPEASLERACVCVRLRLCVRPLGCPTTVSHPEFEIRSLSPGGPESKPPCPTCPLTRLLFLLQLFAWSQDSLLRFLSSPFQA